MKIAKEEPLKNKLNSGGKPVKCTCGKMVARIRNGKVYVYCKTCKREVPLVIEPRASVAQSH
jgi:hypothetical protein